MMIIIIIIKSNIRCIKLQVIQHKTVHNINISATNITKLRYKLSSCSVISKMGLILGQLKPLILSIVVMK